MCATRTNPLPDEEVIELVRSMEKEGLIVHEAQDCGGRPSGKYFITHDTYDEMTHAQMDKYSNYLGPYHASYMSDHGVHYIGTVAPAAYRS